MRRVTAPGSFATAADGGLPTLVAPADWRAVDFFSDTHLAAQSPLTFDAWARHLRRTRADAVFILGDLFEAWIGDDMAGVGFEKRCLDVLRDAASQRTIGFMAGNRDFLVGDALLAENGVMRLDDPAVISAFGTRVMVSHGDSLCIDDVAYQRYRRVVRRAGLQKAFLALPLRWRRGVGQAMRGRRHRPTSPEQPASGQRVVDLDRDAILAWLERADARTFVHGHTHAPASHSMASDIQRHVLSDWDLDDPHAPRAEVLRWTADGFSRLAPER